LMRRAAFTLPLPTLVALLLTGMRMSIQAELDVFFGHTPTSGPPCAKSTGSTMRTRTPRSNP
ncbi:MAG: hypothetical protein QFF03_19265, partial [Pseudomonadota bacterium]|nr:hypothetical protein [Pseudomonadota bacterium]